MPTPVINRQVDWADAFADEILAAGIDTFTMQDFRSWLNDNTPYAWGAYDTSMLLQNHRITTNTRYTFACSSIGRGATWKVATADDAEDILRRNMREKSVAAVKEIRLRALPVAAQNPQVLRVIEAARQAVEMQLTSLNNMVDALLTATPPNGSSH